MRYVGKDWRLDTSRKLSLEELTQIAAVLGEVRHERPAGGADLEARVKALEDFVLKPKKMLDDEWERESDLEEY